jgi:DNA-binding transcriptional regulator YiaG
MRLTFLQLAVFHDDWNPTMTSINTRSGGTVAERIGRGMSELEAIMAAAVDPRHVLTWHAVEIQEPTRYRPEQARVVRDSLGLSQPLFAKLIGVSPALVKMWEQRQQKREPAPWARRILDSIQTQPAYWRSLVRLPTGGSSGAVRSEGGTRRARKVRA